ncbi:MAG: [protein-PII] uridylyltransferase [Proteobacteria bacterium]|nr:[protein-PII] uridylyltransferase [Pseudomonadota bacterium]MBU1060273.1 [protein-PII] uridylyltransferase [Pseudomonadota bacterium]
MSSKLRAQRESLEELWKKGLSGQALLSEQSRLVDEFIAQHFNEAADENLSDSVALVALGGYGRRELFPYSDIDLLILYRPEAKEGMEKVANAVLYPLWDTGLDVGHGVRTVEECLIHAREDFFFQVAMLDSRLLVGSSGLYDELRAAYRQEFIEGTRDEFVQTMKSFRQKRRERFGSHSYLLEPNIKESKGGMRDIQAMLWTALVVFGLSDLEAIADAGVLLEEEKNDFLDSWNMLARVRNRLHYISGRKNDQLYFEQQEEVAAAFGYRSEKGVLGVEHFMRDLYGHLQTVAVTTDLFFDHVDDVLERTRRKEKGEESLVVEKGIEIRHKRIHLTVSQEELAARPYLLMRTFLASAKNGLPLHHRTRKMIGGNLHLVTDRVRSSSRMAKPFFEILETGIDVLAVLEVMLETGLLSAYIPEFGHIESLAQHDVYHIYTVDRHLLQTVAELRLVASEEEQVFQTVAAPHVLYLAALLHDIGKGAGGNHSQIGAEAVGAIGLRLGFDESECACLRFVTRYHLFIPENALRRDLNDELFIRRCAEEIADADRLAMLYLIAVADSRATGPSAWSDWKATLLFEMYLKVLPYLQLSETGNVTRQVDQGVDWLREQVGSLLVGEEGLHVCVDDLPADYLLSFTPEVVAAHVRMHRDHFKVLQQKALVFPRNLQRQWSLLIMCRDQRGLLAKICGVLSLHNLSVLNAQIFTWINGNVVDVLDVQPDDGTQFEEKDWQALNDDLNLALNHRLGLGHRLYKKLSTAHGRRKRPSGISETRVVIDNKASDHYTIIEVYSSDIPGQLYHITQTLADFGIDIYRAYIATEVEQLIDVFYVLDSHGKKVVEAPFIEELREGILYGIDDKT